MKKKFWQRRLMAAVASGAVAVGVSPALAVEYANIDVVDGSPSNTAPPTATIPSGQATAGFFVDPGAVPGEIPIRIGASAADDAAGGILIAQVREILRQPAEATQSLSASPSIVWDDDATSENTRNLSGGMAIVTDRAGNDAAGAAYPLGGPMNVNVAAAYFPFSEGWKGATVWASQQNAIELDMIAGSAGIQLGTHVKPNFFYEGTFDQSDANDLGNHFVSIPGVVDSRQQGILLTMHAKNEDNFTAVSHTAHGDGWHVNTRGNAQDSPSQGESKPFSFVFVPVGTPNVTMGAIWGATGPANEPVPVLKSGANFSIAKTEASGTYRLTIDGQTPDSGALIVQTGASLNGSGGLPGDNLVTYQPDGDGWIITSDDLANINQGGANQNGQAGERTPYFQFVFMPFNAQPGAPTIQAPQWTKQDTFAFNVKTTEIRNGALDETGNNGNDQNDANGPDMYTEVVGGTSGIDFVATRMNKADNGIHAGGALPTTEDGIMFAQIREGLRNNSATGGIFDFGIAGVSLAGPAGLQQWEVVTSGSDPTTGEANLNYAVAFFGKNSGFQMDAISPPETAPTPESGLLGKYTVNLSGVDSRTDGVLIANNFGNEDNFVTVDVLSDGSGWEIQNWDNGLFPQNVGANYVFLPYETENLIAGRVNMDGTLVNSTNPAEFTLVKDGTGSYLLTIPGRTPDQGMLLLTGTGATGSVDNTLVYEAAGNSFRILGIDMVSNGERESGTLTSLEDTSFQFAFIDFLNPLVGPGGGSFLEADFNQDGSVDGADLTAWKGGFGTGTTKAQGDADGNGAVDGADFLMWQRQFGQAPPAVVAAAAVPEPASALLSGLALSVLAAFRRNRS